MPSTWLPFSFSLSSEVVFYHFGDLKGLVVQQAEGAAAKGWLPLLVAVNSPQVCRVSCHLEASTLAKAGNANKNSSCFKPIRSVVLLPSQNETLNY